MGGPQLETGPVPSAVSSLIPDFWSALVSHHLVFGIRQFAPWFYSERMRRPGILPPRISVGRRSSGLSLLLVATDFDTQPESSSDRAGGGEISKSLCLRAVFLGEGCSSEGGKWTEPGWIGIAGPVGTEPWPALVEVRAQYATPLIPIRE